MWRRAKLRSGRAILVYALALIGVLQVALPAVGAPAPSSLAQSAYNLAFEANDKSDVAVERSRRALRRATAASARSQRSAQLAKAPITSSRIQDNTVRGKDIARATIKASQLGANSVGPSELEEDALGAEQIANNAVGESEISTGAVGRSELATDAVTADEILDQSIALGDLDRATWQSLHGVGTLASRPAAAVANEGFLYFATDVNGGTLYRSNGSSWVTVGTAQATLTDDSVTAAKIAADAVASSEIATDAVAAAEIATGAVAAAEIASDAVTADEIAADAVASSEIAADAVTASEIATDAVGSAEIATNAVDAAELATGAAPSSDLAIIAQTSTTVWTNMPAAETEIGSLTYLRVKYDLTNATEVRLVAAVATAGAATPAKIRVQYSTNDGSSWNYLDDSSGPSVDIDTTGVKTSSVVSLASAAKTDVLLRLVGLDGNGTADPAFGRVSIQVR